MCVQRSPDPVLCEFMYFLFGPPHINNGSVCGLLEFPVTMGLPNLDCSFSHRPRESQLGISRQSFLPRFLAKPTKESFINLVKLSADFDQFPAITRKHFCISVAHWLPLHEEVRGSIGLKRKVPGKCQPTGQFQATFVILLCCLHAFHLGGAFSSAAARCFIIVPSETKD
jgi:hypothetical protein